MPSPSPDVSLTTAELDLLVDIADDTLAAALFGGELTPPPVESFTEAVLTRAGAFVTLNVNGSLNGCIGDVAGREPLAEAVARLALAAAFDDPRLPALRAVDYQRLTIEVSVLSPMVAVAAADRRELIDVLRPHRDGLVIGAGARAGLFLPSVWEQLPDPDDFLDQLWRKAGLPPWVWPDRIERFTTEHRQRPAGDQRGRQTPA